MISLDIVNLFTNIPIDKTLKIVQDKLSKDNSLDERTKLPISEIMFLIKFIMDNNYFSFDNKIYQQVSGAPMGCNLSPILAEALVSTIFEQAISNNNNIKFCRFFVDDSFLIINYRHVDNFYKHINSIGNSFGKISFTIEKEHNNSLAFLDTKLTRLNNHIITSVFRKNTHSHRYLNFYSHSSIQNKKGVINNLVTRSIRMSNDQAELNKDIDIIKNGLKLNNYPNHFVDKSIHDCIAKSDNEQLHTICEEIDFSKMIIIPYYKALSEKISYLLRSHGIKVVYKRGNTIGNMLSRKPRENDQDKYNIVYNIDCNDCPQVYIGQTKRSLKTRIKEHKSALYHPYLKSNVADHAINYKHNINFDNPKIKYREKNSRARKFLESFDIEKFKQAKIPIMNDQQNSQCIIPNIFMTIM